MKKTLLGVLCLLSVLKICTAQNVNKNPAAAIVKTANGILEGVVEKTGIRAFKGIPFAAAPVGNLRWAAPQPAKDWKGIREAKDFGFSPMQNKIYADMIFRSKGVSEDCLYLNVWVPAGEKKLLPVLVYFYGGGFIAGDASERRYDGESMATKGIITITVNYRLGVFGFMAHPELTKESPDKASGNYGLLDQTAALKWVQKNITAFGGDPKRVTIAGESAGSVAVCSQMASPLAKNLFAGAIGESGSVLGTLSAVPLDKGEQIGVAFQNSLGANSLAEMRAISGDSLLKAIKTFNAFKFSITVDGYFFPTSPYAIFEAGKQAHIPLLAGWNAQENDYHNILGDNKPTKENFATAVQKLYGENAGEILKNYSAETDAAVQQAATDLAGDRSISYSTWKWMDMQVQTGEKPVYRYLFKRPRPAPDSGLRKGGAVHSAEIEYAMGNLATNKTYSWDAADYKISNLMQSYFVNFIKTANPNGAGLPEWQPITKTTTPVLHIDVQTKIVQEQFRGRYLLLDKLTKR